METTGLRRLFDLGSGKGGGTLQMWAMFREAGHVDLELVFTDRFPSTTAAATRACSGGVKADTLKLTITDFVALCRGCGLGWQSSWSRRMRNPQSLYRQLID